MNQANYDRAAVSLWRNIEMKDGCWEWKASRDFNGYGQVMVDGHMTKAHRAAWFFSGRAQRRNMFVLHSCDNPGCCRPSHLFLGTQSDNMTDKADKGRAVSGTAVLTWGEVLEIRRDYIRGRDKKFLGNARELAVRYNTGKRNIARIASGERWANKAALERYLQMIAKP